MALKVVLLGEPLAAARADCLSALAAGELVPAEPGRGELARAVRALFGSAVAGLVDGQVLLEDGAIADGAGDVLRLSPAFPPLLEGKLRSQRSGRVFDFFFCVRLRFLEPQDLFDKVFSEVGHVREGEGLVRRCVLVHLEDEDVVVAGAVVDAAVLREAVYLVGAAEDAHVLGPVEDESEELVFDEVLEPLLAPALGHDEYGAGAVILAVDLEQQVDEPLGAVKRGVAHQVEPSKMRGLVEGVRLGIVVEGTGRVATAWATANVDCGLPAELPEDAGEEGDLRKVVVVARVLEGVLAPVLVRQALLEVAPSGRAALISWLVGDLEVLVPVPAAGQDVVHLLVLVDAFGADHRLRGPGGGLVVVVADVDGLPLHSEAEDLEGFHLAFAAPADLSERYLQLPDLVDEVHGDVVVGAAPVQLVDRVGQRGRQAAVLICFRMRWLLRLFFRWAPPLKRRLRAGRGVSALQRVLYGGRAVSVLVVHSYYYNFRSHGADAKEHRRDSLTAVASALAVRFVAVVGPTDAVVTFLCAVVFATQAT